MQRNVNTDDETTKTMGTTEPIHSRTNNQETGEHKGPENESYVKGPERTEILHLVARHPEIPEEMGISRDDRKKLAGVIPEYPTRKSARNKRVKEQSRKNRREIHIPTMKSTLQRADGKNKPYKKSGKPECKPERDLRKQMQRTRQILQWASRRQATHAIYLF